VYVDFPPSFRPTRDTVVRSSFRTMENSRSTFPPMNEETVVPKVLAIFTSVPREGETIRFSICVSSAAENPVRSANCCTVMPMVSRNAFTCSPTGTSGSPVGPSGSPDSLATSARTSSIVSSRVASGRGGSFLQCVDVQRDELFVLLRDHLREAVEHRREHHDAGPGDVRPERDHRRHLPAADLVAGDVVRGDTEEPDIVPGPLPILHQGTVDDEVPARREHGEEFLHRGTVHDEKPLRAPDHGGANLLVGDDHRAVRRTAPHLHPVRGEVGDVLPLFHRREGQQVPDHQDPLAAEPRHDDVPRHAKSACFRSLNTPSGKYSDISPSTRFCASSGFIPQFVGQVERYSPTDSPIPAICISNALRRDSFAFRNWAGVEPATRAE